MGKFIITGGNKLKGCVKVSGAKNSSLAIIAASLLTKEKVLLENVPDLTDVHTMIEVLRSLGAKVEVHPDKKIVIDAGNLTSSHAPYELVKKMRASFYVSGPLLAREGYAEVPLPGGCIIGSRPVDFHIEGFRKLGADVKVEHGYMIAKMKKAKKRSVNIYLDPRWCSVGTTINMIMCASLLKGVTTTIENAAREPEVVDLINFLIKMGAEIKGGGTSTIVIQGVNKLGSCEHCIIPDRIEAGTFLAAGAITKGDVLVEGISSGLLEAVLNKFMEAGIEVKRDINRIRVICRKTPNSVDMVTAPYPGFPTDMQPAFVALMTKAKGTSVVMETIYDSRFKYVDELRRMGAEIRLVDNTAIIKGVKKLSAAPVEATDLRAGAALVIAALASEGETEISNIEHIQRGYENFEEKLRSIGGIIKKTE